MAEFIRQIIEIYSWIVLGSVAVSWLRLPQDNPVVQILDTFTEPVLKPIRDLMPDMGGLDFSPMVLFVLLSVVGSSF